MEREQYITKALCAVAPARTQVPGAQRRRPQVIVYCSGPRDRVRASPRGRALV